MLAPSAPTKPMHTRRLISYNAKYITSCPHHKLPTLNCEWVDNACSLSVTATATMLHQSGYYRRSHAQKAADWHGLLSPGTIDVHGRQEIDTTATVPWHAEACAAWEYTAEVLLHHHDTAMQGPHAATVATRTDVNK